MQPGTSDAAAIEGLAVRLAESSSVADVRYDRLWLERVTTAVVPMRGAGLVVWLACHARGQEIEIM